MTPSANAHHRAPWPVFIALAPQTGQGDNDAMPYVPRPELDAKLETIETRMDGRIARIEDRFEQVEKSLQSTKNTIWYAAATIIATFVAVVTVNVTSFDSGRDTAKMATQSQQQTAAALAEIRQIISDMRAQNTSAPTQPSQ